MKRRRREGEREREKAREGEGKEGEKRKGEASVTGIPNRVLVVLYHVETLRVGWGLVTNEGLCWRDNYRDPPLHSYQYHVHDTRRLERMGRDEVVRWTDLRIVNIQITNEFMNSVSEWWMDSNSWS